MVDCANQVLSPPNLDDITYSITSATGTSTNVHDSTINEVTFDELIPVWNGSVEIAELRPGDLRNLESIPAHSATVNAASDTSFVFPEFGNDLTETHCPLDYTITVEPAAAFLEYPEERTISWANADNSHAGSYVIKLTATGPTGVSASASFTLTIEEETPNCELTSIVPSK